MRLDARSLATQSVTKVPEVTFGFWIIKTAATTLGETGGDWVTMSLSLGYLVGSAIFAAVFLGLVEPSAHLGRRQREMLAHLDPGPMVTDPNDMEG